MSRRIAVFSDGTGNSSAKANKTNVWRLFQALDQSRPDQIASYDDGVGTSSISILAAVGGAFGWGLKRNVLDLYKFACRNYVRGDEIYGFGFSRGAFTIRVLMGFIAREGLISFRSEAELNRNAAAAYRSYRSKSFPAKGKPIVWACRKLRNALIYLRDRIRGYAPYAAVAATTASQDRADVPIRFLGLWDTVEAYGFPIAGLKRGIDQWLWPLVFGDMVLSPKVQRACHALSLDDERTTFHPLLWDEVAEAKAGREGRITQVWFAGVHSNLGGGYPEDQLSLVSLEWMMGEAMKTGLRLDPDAVKAVSTNQSPYAKLYDSRGGLKSYYRYAPRRIDIRADDAGKPILPIVHRSVLMRMTRGCDGYTPITLPHEFWILDQNDKLIPLALAPQGLKPDASKPQLTYLETSDPDVMEAIRDLARPDRQAVRLVWDTVFWRRCLYLLTFGLTVILVLYPWLADALTIGKVARINQAAGGAIASIVDALSGLIPSYAAPWKEALNTHPLEFFVLVGAVLASMAGSRVLEGRIRDRARMAWHRAFRDNYNEWLQQSRKGWRNGLWALFGVGVVGFLLAMYFGAHRNTLWALAAVAVGSLLVQFARALGNTERKGNSSRTRIRSTFALSFARAVRENKALKLGFGFLANHVIPTLFAFLLLLTGVLLINRTAFDVSSAAGRFCRNTEGLNPTLERVEGAATVFQTDQMCWASGLVLEKNQTYEITLTTDGDWLDRELRTDVIGLPTHGWRHVMAFPLKRWWKQNWFKPIARIGEVGNDEYALNPRKPAAPRPESSCSVSPEVLDSMGVSSKLDPAEAAKLIACDPTPMDRMTLTSEITARTTGELFLYVNDAILSIPGSADKFVRNNSGSAKVTVRRVTPND